jgi:lysophospholipid acyltransferase (LPLAT)-like uncharacterized protein
MRPPVSLLSSCVHALCLGLRASLRCREKGREEVDALDARNERMVFCLWHDEFFPVVHVKRQLDIVTVVSPSRDGELLSRVLRKLGMRAARGSSTRGGSGALLEAARLMRDENIHACLTVDGPRGPRHQAKPGAFFLAWHAGAHITPIRAVFSRSVRARSWDRFQVPLPFSRVTVLFGKPWKMEGRILDGSALAEAKARLEKDLRELAPYGERGGGAA